ncbi:MAG: phage major capsid protein [Burkholderiales bacterium]
MDRLGTLTDAMQHRAKMIAATQYLWLTAKFRGRPRAMAEEARRERFASRDLEQVLLSAIATGTTTSAGWAQELAPYGALTATWCKSVTAKTVLGQLDFLRAPFLTKTICDVTPGAASWVAEGQPIPMSSLSLTATDALEPKRVSALVPVTEELLQSWTPAVEANLSDLVSRVVRYTIDRSLLDPDSSVTAARPASLTFGLTPTQSTGSSAAQALADIAALLDVVLTDTQDTARVVIVMSPKTALHLSQLLTTGNTFAFPHLGARGGEIFGVPVIVSPAAGALGSPAANVVAAIDAARIVVADDGLMLAAASDTASLSFTDAPAGAESQVSLFQTGTSALRVTLFKNFVRANSTAVAWFPTAY